MQVKAPKYSLVLYEREYQELQQRYPKLHVVSDFSRLVASWTQVQR